MTYTMTASDREEAMTTLFDRCFQISVLGFESATLEDVPGDPGGPTRLGITTAFDAGEWEGVFGSPLDLSGTNEEFEAKARHFYRMIDWQRCAGDALGWPMCALMFDGNVLHGPRFNQWFQSALDTHRRASVVGPIKVDGFLGEKTLAAWINCSEDMVFETLSERRIASFMDSTNHKFVRGWLNRHSALLSQIIYTDAVAEKLK